MVALDDADDALPAALFSDVAVRDSAASASLFAVCAAVFAVSLAVAL